MATTAPNQPQTTALEPWKRASNHLHRLMCNAAGDVPSARDNLVAAAAGPNLLIAIQPLLKRVAADLDRLAAEGSEPSAELQVRLTDLQTELAFARFAVAQAGGSL